MGKYVPDEDRINPYSLPSEIKSLISLSLRGEPITVKKLEQPIMPGVDFVNNLQSYGCTVSMDDVRLFSAGRLGANRKKDNSDLPVGAPIWCPSPAKFENPSVKDMKALLPVVYDLANKLPKLFEGTAFENDEIDDWEKLSIQRCKAVGAFIRPPMDLKNFKRIEDFPPDFIKVLDGVVRHYYQNMRSEPFNRRAILEGGIDNPETSLGAPTFATGSLSTPQGSEVVANYFIKRLYTCSDCPVPDYKSKPKDYCDKLDLWVQELGLPSGAYAFSSMVNFRTGAKAKPLPVMFDAGGEYRADYEATYLNTFTRHTWMAPFYSNLIMYPATHMLKVARRNILGLWHDGPSMTKYIQRLRGQGDHAYMNDFSAFDTTQSAVIIHRIFQTLFSLTGIWEFGFTAEFLFRASALFPSTTPNDTSTILVQNFMALLSGFIVTSELGTIISVAANLFSLTKAGYPTAFVDWLSGKFIMPTQSDDVVFAVHKELSAEDFDAAMVSCGFKAKLKKGHTFLKKILPIGTLKHMPGPAPLLSRMIQQTFGNEDMDELGYPSALTRLGLIARHTGIHHHPAWMRNPSGVEKTFNEAYSHFPKLRGHSQLGMPLTYMSQSDLAAIQAYSASKQGQVWLAELMNNASYIPNSAMIIEQMKKMYNMELNSSMLQMQQQRKQYVRALWASPTPQSREAIISISRWITGH